MNAAHTGMSPYHPTTPLARATRDRSGAENRTARTLGITDHLPTAGAEVRHISGRQDRACAKYRNPTVL
jgi:hypothetical protein